MCIQEDGEDGSDAASDASMSSGWVEEGVDSGNEGDAMEDGSLSAAPEALQHGSRAKLLWSVLEVCERKHRYSFCVRG
jgi:hypothetical protein